MTTFNGQTVATNVIPDAAWLRQFRRRLLTWYRRNRRDLPWRGQVDPYRVWVSEIMLQQTQVATVVPYFERFIAALPDVSSLAAARERDVLRLWEGLGYYRRARQLHKAAQIIVDRHGGIVPGELDVIRTLPGIGRYTAGAIASIAFDQSAPILEANTIRLHSRLLGYRGNAWSASGQALLWRFAIELLPRGGAGALNQALMELGSLVCSPTDPACHACPVRGLCRAAATGQQQSIPRPKAKPRIESVHEVSVAVQRGGRFLLRHHTADERWAGLWDFLRFPLQAQRGITVEKQLIENVLAMTGLVIKPRRKLTTIRHGVTRYRITLDCYLAQYGMRGHAAPRKARLKWVAASEFDDYPLSTSARKFGRIVAQFDADRKKQ